MKKHNEFLATQYAVETVHAMRKLAESFLPKNAIDVVFAKDLMPLTVADEVQRMMENDGHTGDFVLIVRQLLQARRNAHNARLRSRSIESVSYEQRAWHNVSAARKLLDARLPRHKKTGAVIGMPSITCVLGVQSAIHDGSGVGSVHLPIHWHKTVLAHDLAVCDWGVNLVLVVRARPQPSVFLADMGVSYFEVDGLCMGTTAKAVTGYAFRGVGYRPVFSQSFQTGVRAIKERVEQATLDSMGV